MVNNKQQAAANKATKPCQNCGDAIPVGIIACSPCQREWMLQFRQTHKHLFQDKRKEA